MQSLAAAQTGWCGLSLAAKASLVRGGGKMRRYFVFMSGCF